MGRRKIQVQLISDDRTRHVTFAKRKAGLMKKAMELAILTGCEVALIVIDPSPQRELSEYISTGDSRKLLQEYCSKAHLPHERKTNNDYSSMGRRKAKKQKKGKKHSASSDDEDDSSDDEETMSMTASTSSNNLPTVHEYPAALAMMGDASAPQESLTNLLLSSIPEQPAVQQQQQIIPQQQHQHHHREQPKAKPHHQQQQHANNSKPAAAASNGNNNSNHPLGLTTEQIQQLNLFSEPVTPERFQKIMQEAFSAALTATINAPIIGANANNNNNQQVNNNFVHNTNTTTTTVIVDNASVNQTALASTPNIPFDAFLATPTAEAAPSQQPIEQIEHQQVKRPSLILTKRPMEETSITTTIIPTSPVAPVSTLLMTPSVLAPSPSPSPAKKRKNDKFASLQVQVPVQQAPIRMATGTTPTRECFLLSPLLPSTTSELFPPTPTN